MQMTSSSSSTPIWQAALNPMLVQRLMRPAQQAGLIQTRQAYALLTRHQRMTTRLPLAALAQRGGPMLDADVGPVPIVYAQPAQPSMLSDAPIVNQASTTQTDVHIHQMLPIATPSPQQSTSPGTAVIQRKMMTGATPKSAPSSTLVMAMPNAASTVQPMPAPPPIHVTPTDAPLTIASPAVLPLPVVQPTSVAADGVEVNASSSVSATSLALPVVHINRVAVEPKHSDGTRAMSSVVVLPLPAQASSPELQNNWLIVREQPVPERIAPASMGSQLQARLPFAETPHTQSTPTTSSTQATQTAAAPQLSASQRTSLNQPAQQIQRAQQPVQAAWPLNRSTAYSGHAADQPINPSTSQPLNVDDIVDKVHRKFLRRLANEAERRGVR